MHFGHLMIPRLSFKLAVNFAGTEVQSRFAFRAGAREAFLTDGVVVVNAMRSNEGAAVWLVAVRSIPDAVFVSCLFEISPKTTSHMLLDDFGIDPFLFAAARRKACFRQNGGAHTICQTIFAPVVSRAAAV